MIRVLGTALAAAMMFLTGTAAHEVTHWLVAKSTGARIVSVSLLPPSPEVVYDAVSPGADAWIRASTLPVSLIIFVAIIIVARQRSLPMQLALIAFAIAYLPRSDSDWQPIVALVQ